MRLPELIALVAREVEREPDRVTPRFVRFLIAEGVIDGPAGSRARPEYGEHHARGVLDYLRLRDLGVPMEDARAILRGEAAGRVKVDLGPGLLLIVDLAALQAEWSPVDLTERVIAALETMKLSRKDPPDVD